MDPIKFFVPGKPQGKARARVFYDERIGKFNACTPKKTVCYEDSIRTYCRLNNRGHPIRFPDDIPLTLYITALFKPPNSTSKKKKALMLEGNILPTKKPDIDNIVKSVADALNHVVYKDDTQIVKVIVEKYYAEEEGLQVAIEEYK